MTEPVIAEKSPIKITLAEGKSYAWCACGRSANQPFCDGSHKETGITPHVFKAEESKDAWLCRCKRSGNEPFCDGTHKTL